MTIFSTPGLPNYTDTYLDVASIFLEASFVHTTFFLRTDFRYALGLGVNLLGQGWLMDNGPAVTLGVLLQ